MKDSSFKNSRDKQSHERYSVSGWIRENFMQSFKKIDIQYNMMLAFEISLPYKRNCWT